MRFLLTLAVAAWSLIAATAQTSQFPNINVRTNATVRDLTVTSTNWSLPMPSTGVLGGTAGGAVGVLSTNITLGTATGTATNPPTANFVTGLSLYSAGTQDSYMRLMRSDGVVGVDIWEDSSFGDVYFDHQHNSDTTGFYFRKKVRSGTPQNSLTLIGTNANFFSKVKLNDGGITFANSWRLSVLENIGYPTFQTGVTNFGTRIYVIPKGVPSSGLLSGIKFFGNDWNGFTSDYDDFGLWNDTTGLFINSKKNGTNAQKNIFITRQDTDVIAAFDATNLRVGIGTNAPSEKLEVLGNAKLSGSLLLGTNILSFTGSDLYWNGVKLNP